MKNRAWLFQLPLIALFSLLFYWSVLGEWGELRNPILREWVYPVLTVFKGKVTNLKFTLRGPQKPKNKIVIIAVDQFAIDRIGRWPWHRDVIGDLLMRTIGYEPKAVGLDIVFSEPDNRVSPEVQDVLKKLKQDSMIESLQTDAILKVAIEAQADAIVLGWVSDPACQPLFSSVEDCPIADPGYRKLHPYPDNFERFEIQKTDGHLDSTRTPLFSAINVLANIPLFRDPAKHMGNFDTDPDPDAYIRHQPILTAVNGHLMPSLDLELARMALKENVEASINTKNTLDFVRFMKSGRTIHTSPLGVMEVNFRGPGQTFPYVSAADVYNENQTRAFLALSSADKLGFHCETCKIEKDDNGNDLVSISKAELFKDAIVLFGVTTIGLYDMRAFPFDSNVAGVEGHANIVDNILSGDELVSSSLNSGWMIILGIMTLGALLFAWFVHEVDAIPGLVVFLLSAGAFAFVDQKLLFERLQNWNTSLLYVEFASLFFITLAVKYVLEEQNKKFIKGAFSKYVAPAIVDSILKDPSKLTVGGEKREMTVLFSDIRGFTTFSEKMDAKALSGFLNDYLGLMTNLVFEHEGTLDKYIGDAVMAFWGAPVEQPKHALNACKAAVRMIQILKEHRPRFQSQYGVDVQIGIGLNSGLVSVGNMGSERIFEYTVIGDSVNLASRTEGLTKTYGVSILTTRYTLDCIQKSGETLPPHRVLDRVKVKGKTEAVELVQLLEQPLPTEGLILFDEARRLYTARDWYGAIQKFKTAGEILRSPLGEPDGPCQEFVARCEEFRQSPPDADWEGSWIMTSK